MQAQGRSTSTASVPPSGASAGSSYRFLVRSAEEAAGVIRDQLGEQTRVVSVRSVKAPGMAGWLGGTRLEVIAQGVAAESPAPATVPVVTRKPEADAAPAPVAPVSSNFASRLYAAESASSPSASRDLAPAASEITAGPTIANRETVEPMPARPRRNPPPQRMETLLRRSGLSEPLIARLQPAGESAKSPDQPLHQGLSAIAEEIRELAGRTATRPLPERAAFIGMPGVGRTTALCKWLAAEVFTHGRRGAVASVEFDRTHANEELAVFAELLGLEFSRQVLPPRAEAGEFSYFDLPPLSLTRPEENEKLRAYLDTEAIPGRVLVLSALHDPALLRRACAIGQDLGCTHLVFTHLDELPLWGKLWDFLIEAPFTPLLLSLGPSQTGEAETEVVGAVLRRTFPWN